MIGRAKRVLLRHYLEQGMTKAAIARHMGVSPDTIYRWIATRQLGRDLTSSFLIQSGSEIASFMAQFWGRPSGGDH